MRNHQKRPRKRIKLFRPPQPCPRHRTLLLTENGGAYVSSEKPLRPETKAALVTMIEVAVAAHKKGLLPDESKSGIDGCQWERLPPHTNPTIIYPPASDYRKFLAIQNPTHES